MNVDEGEVDLPAEVDREPFSVRLALGRPVSLPAIAAETVRAMNSGFEQASSEPAQVCCRYQEALALGEGPVEVKTTTVYRTGKLNRLSLDGLWLEVDGAPERIPLETVQRLRAAQQG